MNITIAKLRARMENLTAFVHRVRTTHSEAISAAQEAENAAAVARVHLEDAKAEVENIQRTVKEIGQILDKCTEPETAVVLVCTWLTALHDEYDKALRSQKDAASHLSNITTKLTRYGSEIETLRRDISLLGEENRLLRERVKQ